jgi:hypothetical protein
MSDFIEMVAGVVLMVFIIAWQLAFAAIPFLLILWGLDWLGFIDVL